MCVCVWGGGGGGGGGGGYVKAMTVEIGYGFALHSCATDDVMKGWLK